jgi:NADH-quinone oxidoreductase subunit M
MVMTAIGLPLLAVFISEFLALRGAFESNPMWAAWAALGIILNAGYFLWLYQRMFFGNIENPKNEKLLDMSGREWAYMIRCSFFHCGSASTRNRFLLSSRNRERSCAASAT